MDAAGGVREEGWLGGTYLEEFLSGGAFGGVKVKTATQEVKEER